MAAMVGVGGLSGSKDIAAFSPELEKEELNPINEPLQPPPHHHVDPALEHHEEEDAPKVKPQLEVGPQFSLKEQLDKDKDDESLRKWKEQLLGTVDMISSAGEGKEAEVKMLSFSILSPGRADFVMPIPLVPNSKGILFSLKEGARFRLKFSFVVSDNIVSGLKYINTVWKTGIKVDTRKIMMGNYSPRGEPYAYELEEETTPSGMFVRGSYSVRTQFVDDDGKCYLDVRYRFEIQKKWPSSP